MSASGARRERWAFAAACVAAALLLQGTRGLWETDEGRYAEAARQMTVTGEWLVPMRHGTPHMTKPPGAYWAIAAGLELLGANPWGARLVLGIAFAASAACVRATARALLGDAAGARAGWAYLAMLYPFAMGSVLTADTFLAALVLGSVACLAAASRSARRRWTWTLASGALLGGALLVKGPPAWIPWIAFAAGWAVGAVEGPARRRFAATAGAAFAASAAAGSVWYLWAAANVPGAYEQWVGKELSRMSSPGDHPARPWWFYPAILLVGSAPWWGLCAAGARRLGLRGAGLAVAIWAGVTWLVFQAAASKNWSYLLPVAAPLAVWAAAGARAQESPWPARPALLGAWLSLLLVLRGAMGYFPDERDMAALAARVRAEDPSGALPLAVHASGDYDGLDFHLGRRLVRLRSRDLAKTRSDRTLGDEARLHAERGEEWLLLADADEPAASGAMRTLGRTARVVAELGEVRLLRIVPAAR